MLWKVFTRNQLNAQLIMPTGKTPFLMSMKSVSILTRFSHKYLTWGCIHPSPSRGRACGPWGTLHPPTGIIREASREAEFRFPKLLGEFEGDPPPAGRWVLGSPFSELRRRISIIFSVLERRNVDLGLFLLFCGFGLRYPCARMPPVQKNMIFDRFWSVFGGSDEAGRGAWSP